MSPLFDRETCLPVQSAVMPGMTAHSKSRFSSRQNPFDIWNAASKLCAPDGVVAQLVEHHNGIVGVRSSNLLGSTILSRDGDTPWKAETRSALTTRNITPKRNEPPKLFPVARN